MNRGLIDFMTFSYSYLCKGRGILKADEIRAIQSGAGTVARTAPAVLEQEGPQSEERRLTLEEAQMIQQHIDECTDWLLRLEM